MYIYDKTLLLFQNILIVTGFGICYIHGVLSHRCDNISRISRCSTLVGGQRLFLLGRITERNFPLSTIQRSFFRCCSKRGANRDL